MDLGQRINEVFRDIQTLTDRVAAKERELERQRGQAREHERIITGTVAALRASRIDIGPLTRQDNVADARRR